ncbi:23S rRNA pseudouridine955/2504/2580 synthase [Butyrivibrio fibrisolvens]|uniref:RNA pseudouridylate synthase n=1 Tax=Butyrivibrio fibrisolvens TaxID=831 RepID=A0A1H9UH03_BUTFI|nr:RluA family pseudouridine synthase [Butyrivibrio fibrisolvens]SES08810.1 23S rRNA pseudouridine955/2504/2580 synthase [Butyrivibrio fibrisolvens]
MKEFIIKDNEAGKRLDKFLGQYLSKASTGFIYKMLRKKNIVINGKKATGQEKLQVGDIVTLWLSDDTFLKFANDRLARAQRGEGVSVTEFKKAFKSLKGIEVIHENKDVVFVNKPVGILTQKAEQGDVSLNEWIVGYLLDTTAIEPDDLITFRPSVCNRLDRNTSGIVICAKSLKGAQMMAQGLKDRTFKKYYRTVVSGIIDKPEEIKGLLKKDSKTNTVTVRNIADLNDKPDNYKSDNDNLDNDNPNNVKLYNKSKKETSITNDPETDKVNDSSYIETAYSPVSVNKKWNLTYLEVELRTGKTHQIRAHLSGIGHPIVGDPKYGDEKVNENFKQTYGLKSQLLHCYRLEFPDDEAAFGNIAGMEIVAPLYSKFKNLVKDKFNN